MLNELSARTSGSNVISPFQLASPRPSKETLTTVEPRETVALSAAPPARATSAWRRIAVSGMMALGLLAGSAAMASPPAAASTSVTLKVMTLNDELDASQGVDKIVNLIKASGADVIGLQESTQNTAPIAAGLGFNYVQQNDDIAILSRYPIVGTTPDKYGARVKLPTGQNVVVFNNHPYYKPYQPYQLLGIPYEGEPALHTEAEAIAAARQARGADIDALVKDIRTVKNTGTPMVVMGDFNEPSRLDWTQAAADAGRVPIKVDWPSTKEVMKLGFKDAYRVVYPDEIARPGYTWTPTTSPDDPKDHHDRIDFVFFRGNGIHVKDAQIVGEDAQNADIVVNPYPSDHRAVEATFEVQTER